MEVIVSLDDKKLRRYLKSCPKQYHYVYPGDKTGDIDQWLNEYALSEIKLDNYDESFKESFLQAYVDLIGRLGRQYNSIYWWVTFTASKNRFVSRLSQNLFLFYSLTSALKQNPDKNTVLINPPEEICGSIKQYCLEHSIDFRMLHNSTDSVLESLKHAAELILNTMLFIFDSWRKISLARRHLDKKFAREVPPAIKYYVIRSWFYESSINQNHEYRDSFFGRLPEHLVRRGKKLLVVAGILGDYRTIVTKIANQNSYLIIPQELFLQYTDPLKAIFATCTHQIRVKGKIDFEGYDVSDLVRVEIEKNFRSEIFRVLLSDYMHYYWMKRLLNRVKVDTFTTTCENNPWERMCIMALRQHSPETRILGYQHTVAPQASANMFVSQYEKDIIPMPDRILTVGMAPRKIMERYGDYTAGQVQEACALRFEYLFNIRPGPRTRSNHILLALEGVFEVYQMVNYVLRELKDATSYSVKIRTHPVLPLSHIRHKLHYDVSSLPHVSLSENTPLKDDLEESDMVIYWGSTVALEALMLGKPVINFDAGDALSYDPLFECHHLKWTVNKQMNLVEVIEKIYNMSDEEYERQLKLAREYLSDYFYEITEERLDRFLT